MGLTTLAAKDPSIVWPWGSTLMVPMDLTLANRGCSEDEGRMSEERVTL
jgi:hypothetical protein